MVEKRDPNPLSTDEDVMVEKCDPKSKRNSRCFKGLEQDRGRNHSYERGVWAKGFEKVVPPNMRQQRISQLPLPDFDEIESLDDEDEGEDVPPIKDP